MIPDLNCFGVRPPRWVVDPATGVRKLVYSDPGLPALAGVFFACTAVLVLWALIL